MIPAPMNDPTAACRATLEGDLLTIATDRCERRWRVADGVLHALSFRALGREWFAPSTHAGTVPAPRPAGEARLVVARGRRCAVEEPSLTAELAVGATIYRFQAFPGLAGITVQVSGPQTTGAGVAGGAQPPEASGVEIDGGGAAIAADHDLLERFTFAPAHGLLSVVTLQDRTDVQDNLAGVEELRLTPVGELRRRGCLFAIEDPLTGAGLVLLKHAPLPHARPAPNPVDLFARHRDIALLGHGAGDTGEGYPWTVLAYTGGAAGRTAALHGMQRRFRPYVAGRDGRFLSNTWGDRNRDGRINEAFIGQEIAAAARLGVDVVQIDDGWERGTSANSVNRAKGGVWEGFWAADPQFWSPHPERFPRGLQPTAAAARAAGAGFGLWFAPDSAAEFANWERDAAVVLDLHRDHGVDYVKIDGVKALTKRGEGNLWRFFQRVLDGSAGAVVFDLDVTAEIRPGYFGMMPVGPLFVENRYTDWGKYWPHATLRNLWQLAHWIDPTRLRMELLNHTRNPAAYGDDPLAPARYRPAYLFATVMIANPLGWFEVSGLPSDYVAEVAALVRVWKEHRDRLHGGRIRPIGDTPSGASWTGFLSEDDDQALLIVLRERTANEHWHVALPAHLRRAEVLAGSAEIGVDADGLVLRIADQLDFAFIRVRR
jgi:alpha-galactosidase